MYSHYNLNKMGDVSNMFNNMTTEEKILIRSMNFEHMWYHMYSNDIQSNMYMYFYVCYLNKLGGQPKLLLSLIENSNSVDTSYEFPKGRKSSENESNIATAIRELQEETGLNPMCYQIIKDKKICVEDIDNNVKYLSVFYVAIITKDIKLKIDLSKISHRTEIQAIEWVSVNNIRKIDKRNKILPIVTDVLKHMRKVKQYKYNFKQDYDIFDDSIDMKN